MSITGSGMEAIVHGRLEDDRSEIVFQLKKEDMAIISYALFIVLDFYSCYFKVFVYLCIRIWQERKTKNR